jgi:CrcB protein
MYIIVGIAGIIGALLRYYLGLWVHQWWIYSFPFATLITNYLGCFALGWFTTWAANSKFPAWLRTGLGTGLIGSFTTFSTFSVETMQLIHQHLWGIAFLYVLLSLWGGLLMAHWGYHLAQTRYEKRQKGMGKS